MLCYFEKIALDELDQRAVRQMGAFARGTKKFMGAMGVGGKLLRGMGNLGMGGARLAGRGMQRLGDEIVQHPTRAMMWGVPVAYGLYKAPGAIPQALSNVLPQNTYQY